MDNIKKEAQYPKELLKFPIEVRQLLVDKKKALVKDLAFEKFTGEQIAYLVGVSEARISQILTNKSN